MVLLDWNKVLAVTPENLTEQEKEEYYEKVAWHELDPEIPTDHLKNLFLLSQEILRFKGDQVEYLVNELDNLAARQGEEDARKQDDEKFEKQRSSHNVNIEELVKLEVQNEQLVTELQAREKELLDEKREVEKFAGQVMILEQEKNELRRELSALQREAREQYDSRMHSSSPEHTIEKLNELTESVKQKNKHITQLLNDIELLEKENKILKEKLSSVRDELEDATRQMTKLAGDSSSLHHSIHEQQENIEQLEEQNVALRRQIAELVAEKCSRDEQLDQLALALDSRFEQWEDIMKKKDLELEEMRQQLLHASAHPPNLQLDVQNQQLAVLTQAIENRDEQIEQLQKRLTQATEDLNKSADILEEYKKKLKEKHLKEDTRKPSAISILQHQLQEAQGKIALLEAKVRDAEEDAQSKAEEMSNMIIQLREYETGEFGLSQAMEQIKELRKQKAVRDKHIEQLVQAGNQLQEEANQLEEENLILREKLGLDVDEVIRVDGIVARHKQDKDKILELSQLVENSEDSQIQLKLTNRELNKTIEELQTRLKDIGNQTKIELVLPLLPEKADADKDIKEVNERLKEVIDENEALRKGMHEILDSIRHHDGSSIIHVESVCLERLLEALDSRHVSGWYHPAMRLQAQLNSLYGTNAELREQLHIARENEREILADLQKVTSHVEDLERQLAEIKLQPESADVTDEVEASFGGTEKTEEQSVSKGSVRAIEFISKLKSHHKNVQMNTVQSIEVNQDVIKLLEKITEMDDLMKETNEKYDSDRESWMTVRSGLEEELENTKVSESSLQKQCTEYIEQLEAVQQGPDELQQKLAENGLRLGKLASDNEILDRKVKSVLDMEGRLRSKYDSLTEEFATLQASSREAIGQLTREKDLLASELKIAENSLQDSVPITEFESIKNEMNQLTVKHRNLVNQLAALETSSKNLQERISEELSYWKEQCEQLKTELVNEKTKSVLSTVTEHPEEIVEISKKLAESQLQEEVEKLKFEHTERMYKLIKEQVTELEARCKQLETDNAAMVQHNLSAQLLEAELRNQLVNSVSHDQYSQLKTNLLSTEKYLAELKAEKSKLLEEVEIALQQVKALEGIRKAHDFQHDALQRQILELSAVSDDKATIGRLTRELSMVYQHETASNDTVIKQQAKLLHLETVNSQLQAQIKNLEEEHENITNNFLSKYRLLTDVIHDLHRRYLGSIPLVTMDTMGNVIIHLQQECQKLKDSLFEKYVLTSKELVRAQIRDNDDIDDESKKKIPYNCRLQELSQRIEIEALEYRVKHAEGRAERQEKLCREIQEELISMDTSWERKLLKWEETQFEMCKKLFEPPQDIETSQGDIHSTPSSPPLVSTPIPPTSVSQSPVESPKEVKSSVDTPTTAVEVPKLQLDPISPQSDARIEQQISIIASLQDQLSQANMSLNQQSTKLLASEKICSDLQMQLAVINAKLEERNNHLTALKIQLSEKNTLLLEKEKELIELHKSPVVSPQYEYQTSHENTETLALKATVASLQNIVNQKEETIGRYQILLKECREEHNAAVASLQEEISNLQQVAFEKQSQLTHREKEATETAKEKPDHVRSVMEKYLVKVHELEDELAQAHDEISQLTRQLIDCKKNVDRLKSLPSAREKQNTPSQWSRKKEEQQEEKEKDSEEEKVDSDKDDGDNSSGGDGSNVGDGNEDDENVEMKELETAYAGLAMQLKEKTQQIEKQNQTISELKKNKAVISNRDRLRAELERKKRRLEMLESRHEEDKTEINRLRHQLTNRPSRPEGVASIREEQLQRRIKTLEEQLAEAQQREEKEQESHRSKCAEEVERWQERKRWQTTNEKLRAQIKTQTTQIEALKSNQQRLRDTISRLERDRNTLEYKLKSLKGSAVTQTLVEELEKEVKQLKARNELLKKTSELTSGSSSLSDVIESQQRKIEALQLAQKGESALAEEVERLQERKSQLQKINLKLEGENLKLKLELEKFKTHQNDSDVTPESDNSDSIVTRDTGSKKSKRTYADLERAVIVLRRVVEKLQTENKKLHGSQVHNLKDKNYVEKLQIELQKAQESYMDTLDKVSSLEAQLQQEKSNCRMIQEQLVQKARLLTKCKILLERAAIREKALNEQVSDLQKLVPPETLRGTYHESR